MGICCIDVLDSIRGTTRKIVFGANSIKNLTNVYQTYSISRNEQIIAYLKSTVPFMGLTMDGLIITDQAIYIHPCHNDWASHNRFSFSNICCYLVRMEGNKAALQIEDDAGVYTLVSATLFGENVGGKELKRLFEVMQEKLLSQNEEARKQRNLLFQRLSLCAQKEMSVGRIAQRTAELLGKISEESEYTDAAITLLAKDILRTCNYPEYIRYVSLKNGLSQQAKKQLDICAKEWLYEFVSELKADSQIFQHNFLNSIYQNIITIPVDILSNERKKWLKAYILARLDNRGEYYAYLKQLEQETTDTESIEALIRFECCYRNHKMIPLFRGCKNGARLDGEQLEWTDSLGFTPLHYCLILQQTEAVEKLASSKRWSEPPNFTDDKIIGLAYDYVVIARYLNLSLGDDLYIKNSELIRPLLKSKDALEHQIGLKEKRLSFDYSLGMKSSSTYRDAVREHGRNERTEDYRNRIENLKSFMDDLRDEIRELKDEVLEIEQEIKNFILVNQEECKITIRWLKESADPLVQLLLSIFDDPSILDEVLSVDSENCIIYTYGQLYFAMPPNMKLNIPLYCRTSSDYKNDTNTSSKKNSKETPYTFVYIDRPYGNSWFSPQAHIDFKLLKTEYHALARKYHPDCNPHPQSKSTFQQILNERATILESFVQE